MATPPDTIIDLQAEKSAMKICQKCKKMAMYTVNIAGFALCEECVGKVVIQCEHDEDLSEKSCSICAGDGLILNYDELPEPTEEMLKETYSILGRVVNRINTEAGQ